MHSLVAREWHRHLLRPQDNVNVWTRFHGQEPGCPLESEGEQVLFDRHRLEYSVDVCVRGDV